MGAQIPVSPSLLGVSVGASFDPNPEVDAPLGGLQEVQIGVGVGIEASSTVGINDAITVRDAANALGRLRSNQSASFSENDDGSVNATISTLGSRITRDVTCASNHDGEVRC